MRNQIDIDHKHSRAIVQKIGERLRASLKPEPEVPARLRKQLDRLRELEERAHPPLAMHYANINRWPCVGICLVGLDREDLFQSSPIRMKAPTSVRNVMLIMATVRNTSPVGSGVIARLIACQPHR